jgi:hypothetical protein
VSVFVKLAADPQFSASMVQLVDSQALHRQSAMTEDQQVAFVEETRQMCLNYESSLVMLDLWSLAEPAQSERASFGGAAAGAAPEDAVQSAPTHHRLLNKCRDFFNAATNDRAARRWVSKRWAGGPGTVRVKASRPRPVAGTLCQVVCFVESHFSAALLREGDNWPKTDAEAAEEEAQERTRTCFYCNKRYTEAANEDEQACHFHADYFDQDTSKPQVIFQPEASAGDRALPAEVLRVDTLRRFGDLDWTRPPTGQSQGLNPEIYSCAERTNAVNAAMRTQWGGGGAWQKMSKAAYNCCGELLLKGQGCKHERHSDVSRLGPEIFLRALLGVGGLDIHFDQAVTILDTLRGAGWYDLRRDPLQPSEVSLALAEDARGALQAFADATVGRPSMDEFLVLLREITKTLLRWQRSRSHSTTTFLAAVASVLRVRAHEHIWRCEPYKVWACMAMVESECGDGREAALPARHIEAYTVSLTRLLVEFEGHLSATVIWDWLRTAGFDRQVARESILEGFERDGDMHFRRSNYSDRQLSVLHETDIYGSRRGDWGGDGGFESAGEERKS